MPSQECRRANNARRGPLRFAVGQGDEDSVGLLMIGVKIGKAAACLNRHKLSQFCAIFAPP
jgi:hypothetical protein